MKVPSTTVPVYLRGDAHAVFGLLHMPASNRLLVTPVLICPPFGWDDICSYRSRRDWATHLASRGRPTLRLDLPGTGDSGSSPHDPALLEKWSGAVSLAAKSLRELSGCNRVAAIGIGLGGLVICNAISDGAPIDTLVLWATPSRGRTFLRELRVFARLEDSDFEEPEIREPLPLPEGFTGAGGFLLSAETTGALEQLDIATLDLSHGQIARVLLLERDGIAVEKRLIESLQDMGTTVTVAPGPGYGAMMAKPHLAQSPTEVFAQVDSWLAQGLSDQSASALAQETSHTSAPALGQEPPGQPAPPSVAPSVPFDCSSVVELNAAGGRIRETTLTIEQPFGKLFGILAEPLHAEPLGVCAVMLNAGAIRRVGPNRMWVEASRRWAARGVPTLRLDLEGIGDADGDANRFTELAELYVPELVDQVSAAVDTLQARGLDERFVLTGLCSGAYWSFHGALRDERVVGAFMLNPRALFWDPSLQTARDFRRGVLRRSSWRRVIRREVPPGQMLGLALRAPFVLPGRWLRARYAHRHGDDELDRALDRLRDAGKQIQFVFSGNEPLYEELELEGRLSRLDRWPNVGLDTIPGRDHTLRPLLSQKRAHEALDRALERELERTAALRSSG